MYNYRDIEPDNCEYIPVGAASDLPNGSRLFLEIDRLPVVVFRLGGELFAIADVCSHDDGPVGDGDLEDFQIVCPRHGAHFDIRTGKALSLPAIIDIPSYPVRVVNGQIEVGLPRSKDLD